MRSKGARLFVSPSIRRRALSFSPLSTFARSKPIRSNTPNVVGRRVEGRPTTEVCPGPWTMLIRTPQFLFVGLAGNLEFIGLCRPSHGQPRHGPRNGRAVTAGAELWPGIPEPLRYPPASSALLLV